VGKAKAEVGRTPTNKQKAEVEVEGEEGEGLPADVMFLLFLLGLAHEDFLLEGLYGARKRLPRELRRSGPEETERRGRWGGGRKTVRAGK